MSYQNELPFLCDVLRKSHINAGVIRLSELDPETLRRNLNTVFGDVDYLINMFLEIPAQTVYRFTDDFECCYRFFLLDDTDNPSMMYVGPYLKASLSAQQILEIGEKNKISPQKHRYLSEYYATLVVLVDGSPILTMLNTFCERMWSAPNFSVKDITYTKTYSPSESPFSRSMLDLEAKDTLVNMRTIERRYSFENEMIRAVSLGQTHLVNRFRMAFSNDFFEKRAVDPLRNAKNYGIIMNTLLRKAAESGGVHPIYLDRVSSDFAAKIENMSSLSENAPLMFEMFRTYCRLVRTHSLQGYSTLVQRTILIIEADLSANLSPNVLAAGQDVSLGYLSTLFKKETGETLSAYIRTRRMEYAEYLLGTSNLQIQNVALHCGIMDVQYFTKLFKKQFGKTPTEYRRQTRKKD